MANRIIGTVYRVLLVRTAGEEVIGLIQMTWPVYRVAWTLATAGLYVAIARLLADSLGSRDVQSARAYGRVGLLLTVGTATLAAAFLFATRHLFANHFLTDPRTIVTLTLFPLLLIPAALSHTLRGILQGQERLGSVAASSVIEATSRVPVVLFLVAWLLPFGPAWAAGGIALGLAVGEILSLIYLAWSVRRSWRPLASPKGSRRSAPAFSRDSRRPFPRLGSGLPSASLSIAGALGAVALPVLFSGLVNGILGMFNVALIPRQLLAAGLDATEATIVYGRLFGMALPLLFMPMVAVHPMAHAAIPAVARRLAEGKVRAVRRLLGKCFFVAAAVAAASAFAFWNFGEGLGRLLYTTEGLGVLVKPLAIAAPFAYIGHVAAGVLYGMGRTGIAMVNTVAGSVVRLALIYLLVPHWGIVGALWAVVIDFALTAILDSCAVLYFMQRQT